MDVALYVSGRDSTRKTRAEYREYRHLSADVPASEDLAYASEFGCCIFMFRTNKKKHGPISHGVYGCKGGDLE